ncbi:MAG: hypothetical protein RI906_126 [Pseudomonadota bacterium]|jgi:hypothetical protein
MSSPSLSWLAPTFAALAIGLRFAALALFTVAAPLATLATVLWATTVSQLVARFIDAGLPSLLRVAGHRRSVRRAIASWRVWLAYAVITGVGALCAISLIRFAPWGSNINVPLWMATMYCVSVALNNIVLQLQFSADNSVGLGLTMLVPPLLPLMVGGSVLLADRSGLAAPGHLFVIYVAGDLTLTVGSLIALLRGRFGHKRSLRLRLLWRAIRWRNVLRFLGGAWFAGLIKTLSQKSERLFAVALLSAEAYVAANYLLAARDALANLSGLSLYRYFNSVLRGQDDVVGARLQSWTWPMLGISAIGAAALWGTLVVSLPLIPLRLFDSAAPLLAVMAAGIVPFLHVNLLASMSIATGTQRVNLACQITMVFSMIVCQMIAWSSGWNAFIGAGPFVAACIVGLLAPRWMRL